MINGLRLLVCGFTQAGVCLVLMDERVELGMEKAMLLPLNEWVKVRVRKRRQQAAVTELSWNFGPVLKDSPPTRRDGQVSNGAIHPNLSSGSCTHLSHHPMRISRKGLWMAWRSEGYLRRVT